MLVLPLAERMMGRQVVSGIAWHDLLLFTPPGPQLPEKTNKRHDGIGEKSLLEIHEFHTDMRMFTFVGRLHVGVVTPFPENGY